jgi:hypothetical protein
MRRLKAFRSDRDLGSGAGASFQAWRSFSMSHLAILRHDCILQMAHRREALYIL